MHLVSEALVPDPVEHFRNVEEYGHGVFMTVEFVFHVFYKSQYLSVEDDSMILHLVGETRAFP